MYCVPFHTWIESALKLCESNLYYIDNYSPEEQYTYGYIPITCTHKMATVEDKEDQCRKIFKSCVKGYLNNLYILFKGTGPEADPYYSEFIVVSEADDFHHNNNLTRRELVDTAELFFEWLKDTMERIRPIKIRDTIDLEEYVWNRSRMHLMLEYDKEFKKIRIKQIQDLMEFIFHKDIVCTILSWL